MTVNRYEFEDYGTEESQGRYVTHEDYAALLKERDALAVENAKLADCANFYRLGFRPVKGPFGIEYKPTEQLLDDCGNTALEAVTTPATDAAIANIQAQVWLEAKDLTKSIIETDSVYHIDFMFDGKIEQLRKEPNHE